MFCLVLVLAQLLCSTFSPAAILRATYYSIVSVFIIALLIGLVLPGIYPLTICDEAGRHRLALFTYAFGGFAHMTAMGFFIGRLPAVRARWYFQGFLVGLTIASGSRTCASALLVIWAAIRMYKARSARMRITVCAAVGAAVMVGLFLVNNGFSGFGDSVHHGLQAFYGTGALEAPLWELSGRVELWQASAGLLGKCSLVGFGLDGARDQVLRAMPWAGEVHNAFFELLLAAGSAGLMCFLAGWGSAIRSSFRSRTGRSALAIHCFLFLDAITELSFIMFDYFGVFLILCLHCWTRRLSVDERRQLVVQRSD